MLKTPAETTAALVRLYDRIWAQEAAGCSDVSWPQRVSLGSCTKSELESDFPAICARADELHDHATALGLGLECATKVVGGTKQQIPSHVVIADVDALARAIRKRAEYGNAVARAHRLAECSPSLCSTEAAVMLHKMARIASDDVDFELVVQAAIWFREHDAIGLTARQVPLAGFHAKWLDVAGRRTVIAQLAGLERLELEQRPPLVRFTYLDPDHWAAGRRHFDSWVVGDVEDLAYKPDIVLICENRDSALWFPFVPRGIAVMGDGFAGVRNVTAMGWVHNARHVVYWGDMDAAGFEILSGYRAHGLQVASMLMNADAFSRYERYGTQVDKNGRKIASKEPIDSLELDDMERELYLKLVDPGWNGVRRIEQERIPLDAARDALKMLCS